MVLKSTGYLVRYLIVSVIMLFNIVLHVIMDIKTDSPFIVGFTFFLLGIVFTGLFIVIVMDLVGKQRVIYTGKVINREGKTIHVLRTDNKLKRYRINVPEVLERLQAEQQVEIALTRLARVPARITIIH